MKVKNPDSKRIYHCWHFCMRCKRALIHSSAELRDHVQRCSYKPHELLTFPSEVEEIEIEV